MAQAYATFTGLAGIKSAFMVRSLGIYPNSGFLTCQMQDGDMPAIGLLTLGLGLEYVEFPDMKVDYATIKYSTHGHYLTVRLLDRRWRWRFALISGRYNRRLPDGTMDAGSQKTAQELAALCFEAMTEMSYDVSVLPTDYYPEVDWIYDRADLWLHDLCESCGCDVSLNLDDTVSIVRLGEGNLLPTNGDLLTPSITANPPEGPDALAVVCNETQYQSRLKCQAVALETNNQIVPVEDVSYWPSGGFADLSDVSYLQTLRNNGCSEEQISCAKRSLFKWFQVVSQANGSQTVPGYGTIDSITQILPLNNYQLESYTAFSGTKRVRKPDIVLHDARIEESPGNDLSPEHLIATDSDFTVDRVLGLVKFPRAMVKHEDDGTLAPAEIYLETSYGVRSNSTDQQDRYVATRELVTGGGPLMEASRREEIGLVVRALYDDPTNPTTVDEVIDNSDELTDEVESILDSMAARYAGSIFGYGDYRGIKAFYTDGSIRQVAWWVSDSNYAHTMASVNSEASPGSPKWWERRRRRITDSYADRHAYEVNLGNLRDKGGLRR